MGWRVGSAWARTNASMTGETAGGVCAQAPVLAKQRARVRAYVRMRLR
jgi:hypothetical protein